MATYGLLCLFLNDSSDYAHGVEFGILWARMQAGEPIADYVLLDNQEQVTLAANRLGWRIVKMETREDAQGWVWIEMEPPEGD